MARQELLDDAQGAVVRSIVKELYDSVSTGPKGEKGAQARTGKLIGLSQQTVSKALDHKSKVGITVAVQLARRGYADLAALLSSPPARWNGQVATLDRALVRVAYERPYKAAAYTQAAIEFRERPWAFSDRDPKVLTVDDTMGILRAMVGEAPLLDNPPEPPLRFLPPKN